MNTQNSAFVVKYSAFSRGRLLFCMIGPHTENFRTFAAKLGNENFDL